MLWFLITQSRGQEQVKPLNCSCHNSWPLYVLKCTQQISTGLLCFNFDHRKTAFRQFVSFFFFTVKALKGLLKGGELTR